jgi:hypothetical protein
MSNKKRILLLLLLLLIAAAVWYFYPQKKMVKQEDFTEQGQIEISAGNITMKVWDNEAEDGDTIQVFFKGKMIADTLAILNNPVEYKLGTLSAGEYWIGVKAINEGTNSPASASVSLNDGTVEKEFIMDAWVDSAASWKVIVK